MYCSVDCVSSALSSESFTTFFFCNKFCLALRVLHGLVPEVSVYNIAVSMFQCVGVYVCTCAVYPLSAFSMITIFFSVCHFIYIGWFSFLCIMIVSIYKSLWVHPSPPIWAGGEKYGTSYMYRHDNKMR